MTSPLVVLVSIAQGAALPAVGPTLFSDDFDQLSAADWLTEVEDRASITRGRGTLDIDTNKGLTVWFRHELSGRIAIEFDATAVATGGANDRVSDLNVFFMAKNASGERAPFARQRSGRFEDYNDLVTYYVGLGGNGNTTTRFRRYIGDRELRPLLPEHDLSGPEVLLVPNRKQRITIVVNGNDISYWRDGIRLLHHRDPQPYTRGWFALRTTQSHLRIERFRVYRLR